MNNREKFATGVILILFSAFLIVSYYCDTFRMDAEELQKEVIQLTQENEKLKLTLENCK